jgi:hypothetical protein
VDLARALDEEKGARAEADTRAGELSERVRLLEAERERLLAGLVERARVGGAPAADGAPGPDEGGADLAGFIAELRAEIERLRAWRAAAEAAGVSVEGPRTSGPARGSAPEPVAHLADRLRETGRVGLTGRDTDQLKELLTTRSDRVLYERSMEQLGSKDPHERVRGARALEALGSKASAPLLAAALGREPEPEVKAALLGALARFKEPFAAELADRELRDPRPQVRVAALDALAAVAADAAEERLARALRDESPLVRRRAALLLAFARGPGAEDALQGALADPDRGVARAAAAALSGRPSARAQNALARALEHEDGSVRRAAAAALGRWTGERVDADAPAHDRRRNARRIAERLAAMGGSALRDAVLGAAPAAPAVAEAPAPVRRAPVATAAARVEPARVVAAAPAAAPPPRPVAIPAAVPARSAAPPAAARATPSRTDAPAAPRLAAASRVAVLEIEDAPAPDGGGLDETIVAEIRAALRGRTTAELAAAAGADLPRVEAALHGLAARGAVALRGVRWFTS